MSRFGSWLLLALALAGLFLLAGGHRLLWPEVAPARALPVPEGDQEIAWIHTAVNAPIWERFVAGARQAEKQLDGLHVDCGGAFPRSTTAVPEVVVGFDGVPGRLRVRWYKLTSRSDSADWAAAFAGRSPPPLAVIGGGSTDRAVELADALAEQTRRGAWAGDPPLLLLTTATANEVGDQVVPDDPGRLEGKRLLTQIHEGRTFRFCFTNAQMAAAVMDFLRQRPGLDPRAAPPPALAALAGSAAAVPRVRVFAVVWKDDPYSPDLYYQFRRVIRGAGATSLAAMTDWPVPYSVGRYYRANPWEAEAVDELLAHLPRSGRRSLLILPTVAAPARRVLRNLCALEPLIGRDLVAVTGDSISWNTVYRDGDFAWSVQAMPVPLVFFAHQNPVAWDDPPEPAELYPPNGTDDVLRNADIVRLVARAAFPGPGEAGGPRLVARADELRRRLKDSPEHFFDRRTGDRLPGTGECVVCVLPRFDLNAPAGAQVLPGAVFEVWQRRPGEGAVWCLIWSGERGGASPPGAEE